MRTIASAALSVLVAASLGASGAYAAAGGSSSPGTSGDPQSDMAKIYRVKHELKLPLEGTQATLDGKTISTNEAIVQDGRVFIPLRLLRESGAAASVTWEGKTKEARIVMKAEVSPPLRDATFRLGSDRIYAGGQPFGDLKIEVPFAREGITYIPVQALLYLGVVAQASNGTVTLKWSDKRIDILDPTWETNGAETTFTVLFEPDMYPPQVLSSLGSGAWGGGTGKVTEKDVALDGRTYNREQFTATLRPGANPLQLYAITGGTADFLVYRNVVDPASVAVTLSEEGKQYVSIKAPASGYVETRAGEEIKVEGKLLEENKLFDQVTVVVQKLVSPSDDEGGHREYKNVASKTLKIENGGFSGTFAVDEPGDYLVEVDSPKYVPYPESGPASTKWAEFVVRATAPGDGASGSASKTDSASTSKTESTSESEASSPEKADTSK